MSDVLARVMAHESVLVKWNTRLCIGEMSPFEIGSSWNIVRECAQTKTLQYLCAGGSSPVKRYMGLLGIILKMI